MNLIKEILKNIISSNMLKALKTLRNSFRKRGIFNTLTILFYEYWFDFYYKVDTKGIILLNHLNTVGDYCNSTNYQGCNYLFLKKFFKKYKKNISNKTIIDFGSGKGRILLFSILYGAKKCIGIEFAKELIDISVKNIANFMRKKNFNTEVHLIYDDVRNYNLTGEEDVIFFYNPFNDKILEPILKKIASLEKEVLIVYINPTYDQLIRKYLKETDRIYKDLIVYSNKLK